MARTVRWTEAALEDLSAAAEFIARDSRFYALALVREARAATRSLRAHAERGRTVPETRSVEIRELFVKSYRLIYRIHPMEIVIVAFVHGARDLKGLWEREGEPSGR